LFHQIKEPIITAEPSYRVWNGQAGSFGLGFKRIPVATDKTLDLAGMMSAIDDQYKNDVCMQSKQSIGTYVEDQLLRNFVNECSKKCMVLVDEAYTEFR
jgi:histidinol-phosphate/aromatic aminotransferase/cobyric acid decarboxylase-like protein